MTNQRIAAIIVAAGFSSRMNAFKPLLEMGSSTIIEQAIHTFQQVGINEIIVVTGNHAERLEAHIAYTGAICLRSDYTKNKMFDSACLGLEYLKSKCDMAFFTPVDAPLFTIYSLKKMISRMNLLNNSVIIPCFLNEKGHPLLINSKCFEEILSYEGSSGMQGAIGRLEDLDLLNLPDPGLIMDADTPQDYEVLKRYEQERPVPSKEECMKIHEYFRTPKNIIKHCEMVASVGEEISKSLTDHGYFLDQRKVQAAALLHDLMKYKKNHAAEGAELLKDLGYTGISPIVEVHMELDEYDISHITEKTVVYLADKLVLEDIVISLRERFEHKMKSYHNDEQACKAIQRKYIQALHVEKLIFQIINESGNIKPT
ncbi:MAG: NTP transferase domain-containing protein [Eubacteriaceae bacterium]|nr:NTP transferase domain-containing protein [Eubacteriaceae bacterium]